MLGSQTLRAPNGVRGPLTRSAMAGLIAMAAMADSPNQGAPSATVPPELRDDWDATLGDHAPLHIKLTENSAVVYSDRNQVLGYLAGTLQLKGDFTLKVLWELPAFQQGVERPLPATAWPKAILANPDHQYPGYLATKMTLHYDSLTDQLSGKYVGVNVAFNDSTKQYDSTSTKVVDVQLTRQTADCEPLPDNKPIFTISRSGPEAVSAVGSIDAPLSNESPAVSVQTVAPALAGDATSSAVVGVEVEWELRRGDRSYARFYTETDSDGVARLQFALQPDGGFAPADQIRSKPGTVPIGDYEVIARVPSLDTPDYSLSPGLVKPAPPPSATFKLSLKRKGVVLAFLDSVGGQEISTLSWPSAQPGRFLWARPFFRVELADFDAVDDEPTRTITIQSFQTDKSELDHLTVALSRVSHGIYRYQGRAFQLIGAPEDRNILRPQTNYLYVLKTSVTRLTATFAAENGEKTTATLTVYQDPGIARREQVRKQIALLGDALEGIAMSSHTPDSSKRQIELKEQILNRALQALDNPKLNANPGSSASVYAAIGYLEAARDTLPYRPYGTDVYLWQNGLTHQPNGVDVNPDAVLDALPIKTSSEQSALKRNEVFYWRETADSTHQIELALAGSLGLDTELPSDPAERAKAVNAMLTNAALGLGKGLASFALSKQLSWVYAAYVLATGMTLDGDPAELSDLLTAGLDLESLHLHTGPGEFLRLHIAQKLKRLQLIRAEVAALVKITNDPALGDLEFARENVRLRLRKAWAIAKDESLSPRQQVSLISKLLTRVPNPRAAEQLIAEYASIPGADNKRLGTAFHRQEELETKLFFDWMAKGGRVTKVREGMYSWSAVEKGERVTYYEFSEFDIKGVADPPVIARGRPPGGPTPGLQIDGALARVSSRKADSFVRIRDLTARLRDDHYAWGTKYRNEITKWVPEVRTAKATYCEYYWPETNAAAGNATLNDLKRHRDVLPGGGQ